MADTFKKIYRIVRRIPEGRVLTYGDVAALCDEAITARTVGWAMSVAPDGVPWHRVINHEGRLSIGRRSILLQELQRDLLQSEGITFISEDRVALERHRWQPRSRRRGASDD